MIVTPVDGTLRLITQPDHAALSGRIMRQWLPLHAADRRGSILLAVEEHDNGWQELDQAPTVNQATGRINDFINAPAADRQSVWPRGVRRLSYDPWAAALVAQHAVTVYDRYRTDQAWDSFFTRMEALRDACVGETPLSLQDLQNDYAFVRIGDLISLIFCNRWERETYGAWTFERRGDRVVIDPDPFGAREVPVAVTARQIPEQTYLSDQALHQAIFEAPAVTLHGVVAGA